MEDLAFELSHQCSFRHPNRGVYLSLHLVCSYFDDGYVQITHMASGALAGLAGITPGSGYVSHTAGVPYGIIVGLSSFYGGKVRLLTLPPERPLPWSPKACTSSASRSFVPPCARMLNEYALHGAWSSSSH